jgi:hypothetical protein
LLDAPPSSTSRCLPASPPSAMMPFLAAPPSPASRCQAASPPSVLVPFNSAPPSTRCREQRSQRSTQAQLPLCNTGHVPASRTRWLVGTEGEGAHAWCRQCVCVNMAAWRPAGGPCHGYSCWCIDKGCDGSPFPTLAVLPHRKPQCPPCAWWGRQPPSGRSTEPGVTLSVGAV